MRAFATLAAVTALAAALAAPAARATPTGPVATPSGPVRGLVEDGVSVFRGLPYAAPPVGERRWTAPVPAGRWTDVRDATANGPSCPQKAQLSIDNGGDPGRLDEDCLYVNVFTPGVEGRRPVMVWLHGGALIFGSGGLPLYDARALAQRGVVVVAVNYRLGPLGFFAHPALERAAPGGPVNFGLLDQIEALRWVRRHAESFAGDPGRVTVFGQSAGAQSVLALMAAPAARGLFHGAIAQSPFGVPSHTRAHARDVGTRTATAVGLPGERATLAELRRVPADRLARLDDKGTSLAPGFVVGDAAAPRPLLDAFRQGRQARVPLVIGSNSDEATVVEAFGVDPAAIAQQLGRAKVVVGALHPGVDDPAQLGRELARDAVFTAFAKRIATLHSARAPAWRYYFSHAAPGSTGGSAMAANCRSCSAPSPDRGRPTRRWRGAWATAGRRSRRPVAPTDPRPGKRTTAVRAP